MCVKGYYLEYPVGQKYSRGKCKKHEGVICLMDDILIHTLDVQSHKQKVREVLGMLKEASFALNEQKCELFKSQVTFRGPNIFDESLFRRVQGKWRPQWSFFWKMGKTLRDC